MKKINKEFLLISAIFLFLVTLIFWQFFLKGLYPFPGDYLISWYEPWKTDFTISGIPIISHKAVADDVFRQLYPFKILESSLLKRFELPLWNPYNGAGMPLFATMHSGFLNIFNIFFIFMPGFLAWTFYIMIQPVLLSIFTYLYCRKINLSLKASLFSVLTLVLSGFVIARLIFGEYIYVFSILPLLLYIIESFIKDKKTRLIFFLPISIFFLLTSGQPQMIFYVLAFTFSYIVYRSPKTLINLLPFFLIGLGLSAIQLIPTYELLNNAALNIDSSRFIFERFLLPPQHLISILIPNYFGNQGTYNYWGFADYIETVAAIGLIPCFFVILSFLKIKLKAIDVRKISFISAIITILSTLDWIGPKLLFSLPLPIISTGTPSRIFGITTFFLAILSGYGYEIWITAKKIDKRIFINILLFLSLISTITIGTIIFYRLGVPCSNAAIVNCRIIALRNTILEAFVFFLFICFFILYFKSKFFAKVSPIIILILIFIVGLYNSQKFLPFSEKETFLPKNNLLTALEKTTDARVLGLGSANISTDFATYFKFYDPNYYDPLYNRRFGELVSFANKGEPLSPPRSDVEITNELFPKNDTKKRRDRLYELLSINYLIYKKSEIKEVLPNKFWEDKNWLITKNNALPRIYTVSDFEVISDKNMLIKRLFDSSFDPSKTILLEQALPLRLNDMYYLSELKIISYEPNKVIIETKTDGNQLLVLTDNYYPGWKAMIDDKETKIYRSNYTFRAIILPKGSHKIVFKYQPESLKIGIFISLISLMTYAGLLIYRLKNTKSG